jgi:Leucine-rich repeat (LRR) protein
MLVFLQISACADFTALKQGIKDFTVLVELDLSDNNITALPAELVCWWLY